MANTAVLQNQGPQHATWLLTGDGTVTGPTIANATILAALTADTPIRNSFAATYATQALMRAALLLGGPGICILQMLTTVADTTAEVNQASVDVDVDAVTATQPEINITMSDTTGTLAAMTFLRLHSLAR